ncbi:Lipoprotein-anchoring transpeptidase ErfK/SrfK [Loktanella sp. DSM 29012]|uniref:L,D-transpeptidase n=1 Tax=Loktanella gaetbuli TaxID=2881335 RepID=A0ABS8BW49_9RHOB|nr:MULTISPECIES: L,D-transpeptidase [Loktanella]MCB5199977.1 L,D-transpeptidase [Loktanella gaetbuli]SEQ42109.1 Lipoprotein-anchoring transpeptidase ErfK/SrfK [Loktanella sp. DSM 29012]
MSAYSSLSRRAFGSMLLASTAAACAPRVPEMPVPTAPQFLPEYPPLRDAGYDLPAIPIEYTQGINRRMEGVYTGEAPRGSIDVDPYAKFLYHVKMDGTATRYPVGVGRQGRTLSGLATIQLKKAWPGWTPTANMIRTEPEVYSDFRGGIPGGLRSPLGARALYIYRNGRDTFYRVHGTNDLESIGNSGSAGCIRMFNQDIIHLYNNVTTPMTINIRSEAESLRVDPEYFNRGVELPPKIISADELLGPEAVSSDREPMRDELASNF